MAKRAERIKSPESFTPGPWAWFGNTKNEEVHLATTYGGRKFVMAFRRWGMGSAQPCFYAGGVRRDVGAFVEYEREYRDDVQDIDHPDARLIAAAPELFDALKVLVNACVSDMTSVNTDSFGDDESVGGGMEGDCALTFGMIRRALKAIAKAEGR